MKYYLVLFCICIGFTGCEKEDSASGDLVLLKATSGLIELDPSGVTEGVAVDRPFSLTFSVPVNLTTASQGISLTRNGTQVNLNFTQSTATTLTVFPIGALENDVIYELAISPDLKSMGGEPATPVTLRFQTVAGELELVRVMMNGDDVISFTRVIDVPVDATFDFTFSTDVELAKFQEAFSLSPTITLSYEQPESNTIRIEPNVAFQHLKKYDLSISDEFTNDRNAPFAGYETTIFTQVDSTLKFPEISDDALLTKVQEQTFTYFWNFAHPGSGLTRERNTSNNTVTIGGSGFGVMSIIVGIERGFITRQQGVDRWQKIVDFLSTADRWHGVWPHWMNGETGTVIPFSALDNGADLVETAFMIQGLLTVRQYLNSSDPQENSLIAKINQLWEAVEWDFHTRNGQNVLYWHWSPDFEWQINLPIRGWNEGLIIYVLAAMSPTHSIEPEVYHQGWARSGNMQNGNTFYGITLPLGNTLGGPLFFSHYSFLGLDPRNLSDQYANYWDQNVAHSTINYRYCLDNPQRYAGYGPGSWGLTASDNPDGYSAHSPTNDQGVITPTAAISSIPYTPEASMDAIRYFYYYLGDRLWGTHGFYDAFAITDQWFASSYLAIDQGPIIIMIENHRTALLWDLFMSAPEISQGLDKLGFNY